MPIILGAYLRTRNLALAQTYFLVPTVLTLGSRALWDGEAIRLCGIPGQYIAGMALGSSAPFFSPPGFFKVPKCSDDLSIFPPQGNIAISALPVIWRRGLVLAARLTFGATERGSAFCAARAQE